MSANLLTPADLAEKFGVTERKVMEWRLAYGWPCVKVGRKFRFTSDHLEQIIASHTVEQAKAEPVELVAAIAGQTKRSANRRRSA